MGLPEELKEHVQDYRVRVFDIAYLDEETKKSFTSDFKLVAEFFAEKRKGTAEEWMKESDSYVDHPEEVMHMLDTFTKSHIYSELYNEKMKDRVRNGGKVKMCEVAENLKNEGKAEGIVEGKAEERASWLYKLYLLVEKNRISKEEVAEMAGLTVEAFQEEVRRLEKRLIV